MEASQSAQARRQGIEASFAGEKSRGEGERTPRRAALSQSRGQHAHGSEEDILEEKIGEEERVGRKRAAHKKAAKKSPRKRSAKAREKDPRGGLTAAGRKAFAKKDGSHLKPGVRKRASDMTPADMRRKGSWAVRFYGRAKLPPLVDRNGKPTRHALSAHAWGEPVPKTVAAARRIAAKGERLLARYRRTQESLRIWQRKPVIRARPCSIWGRFRRTARNT